MPSVGPPPTHPPRIHKPNRRRPTSPHASPHADARRPHPHPPSRPLRRQTNECIIRGPVMPGCFAQHSHSITARVRPAPSDRGVPPLHNPLHNPQRIFFSGVSTHVGSLARLWCWARRLATGGALPARRRRREPHSGGTHWWNPPSPEAYERPGASRRARTRRARGGTATATATTRDSATARPRPTKYFAVKHLKLHILLFIEYI